MADITKIVLPDNTEYDIKDSNALPLSAGSTYPITGDLYVEGNIVGGTTHIHNERESTRSASQGVWTQCVSVELPPGLWLVMGNVRISGTDNTKNGYAYITLGTDAYTLRARCTFPINVGTGSYANGQSVTFFDLSTTTTIYMLTLPSIATSTVGEYLNAFRLA